MPVLDKINLCIGVVFTLCYFYQIVYLFIAYLGRKPRCASEEKKRIAVLIAARNEEAVIGNLIQNLKDQDYSRDMYEIFLVADNCTDKTAAVAKEAGAVVYERQSNTERGKGYALDFLLKKIDSDYGDDAFDGFLVFDADNLVESDFISKINATFACGYDVVSSYRNSKNYGAGWRAAGQGMWFLRDARVLNTARMKIGGCTFVSGTGFIFSNGLKKRYGGWPFHTLTEDGEFTACNAVSRVKCAYCPDAEFYDEQPVGFVQSWKQRLRWCKGGLQIFKIYLGKLLRGIFTGGGISCFDISMSLAPAYLLSVIAVLVNVTGFALMPFFATRDSFLVTLTNVATGVLTAYMMLFIFSLAVTISEWKKIRASAPKKLLYMFTFPLFIFSFIPVAFIALFKKVEWSPIAHDGSTTLSDIHNGDKKSETE